jgi:hypothetical protein
VVTTPSVHTDLTDQKFTEAIRIVDNKTDPDVRLLPQGQLINRTKAEIRFSVAGILILDSTPYAKMHV